MKNSHVCLLAALVSGVASLPAAYAAEVSLGVGAASSTSVYRGEDNDVYPIPVLNYESKQFYFRGLGGGYYLWNDGANRLSLTAYYLPLGFKRGDNDEQQMKQLDKRRGTLMAGMAYSHRADWGEVRTVLAGDTLDYSNGFVWDTTYLYRFTLGDLSLTPGIGATWFSENMNRYYYGVSSKESARSGFARYRPDDGWSPYLELSANYQINSNWSTWAVGRYTRLSDEVQDSPIVDRSYNALMSVGVSYRF
ncbi:outer membrane protein|uniref:Outer membrane protein n=1 Tax=Brenneria salicis ATCC 15712 = DSM 30166 TaxID=714314 RepID=A0A366I6G2_9GAMM|nr:MipA/OmpV family protein [Brenneria salicis]NMN91592.1 outer membrane protein [Brenneria salicis ATCC 15712 = DSM 30166]RBP63063.1 outer membrane protein [Brenneria salicis ATCC 15712 = DSM 30166]RLM30782.1 MltA-interacting protein MipA [Brenneria salicis ATCC 15712 = DSM 30166]